ncbi:RNA polymerase sigma-70 factor (family 1) [Catalinimonas alkaloidigena]|uniref:RNA polymerase sigma factor n=1 Tax=Catalinimonas alkaloidigena TaxID=1075417 RepID=UPI00240710DD|nr:sigma-70 family RNA polymerase sigma factor [Catalinimonas alkaloidigena]MDF9801289.1 RNA polymerase sigma-70 factor (family 1) [Catalinimonas alkaloidigena]
MKLFLSRGRKPEDFTLVKSLRSGSERSYRLLFDKYHQKILRVSLSMGLVKEDAEEIVQDVFLLVWEQRQKLDENLSLNAFLLTLTKRFVIKKIRRSIISNSHQGNLICLKPAYHIETENKIIFNDLENYTQCCIQALPPVRKEILLLRKDEGLSNDEIALKLGISKRTVENHIYRAIKYIKQHLEKESVISSVVISIAIAFMIY